MCGRSVRAVTAASNLNQHTPRVWMVSWLDSLVLTYWSGCVSESNANESTVGFECERQPTISCVQLCGGLSFVCVCVGSKFLSAVISTSEWSWLYWASNFKLFQSFSRNKDLRELFFCRIDNVSIIWFFGKSFMTLHWFDFSFRSDWKFHNNWRLSFEWMPPFEFRSTSLTDTLLFAEHMCVVNVWNVHTIGRHSYAETSIAYDFCVQVLDTRNHHTLWLSVGVFVYMCSVLLFLDIPRISCCPCVDWCKCVRFVCDCIEMSFYHSVISS